MISVCCCAINAKWDVHSFVECLHEHNKGLDFEIVLAHDNRVDDGSSHVFQMIAQKYPNFRVVTHTRQDTVNYLDWMMEMYECRQRWTGEFRGYIKQGVELYRRGELIDERKQFLWMSSGILYNKAVMAAKGDIVIVTPADFLYLFSLGRLDEYVRKNMKAGYFYSKPGAIWCRISNAPKEWIQNEVTKAYLNNLDPANKKMDGHNIFRDFLRYPSMPSETFLADIRNNDVIPLDDPNIVMKMKKYNEDCFANPNDQALGPSFHGVHVMTKQSWQYLGGFTEEFYGRAFADDKMTRRGDLYHRKFGIGLALPPEFSIAWIGQGEYSPDRLDYYPPNHLEVLKTKDPWWDRHPLHQGVQHVQLHEGFHDREYLNHMSINHHERFIYESTVRFTNGDY